MTTDDSTPKPKCEECGDSGFVVAGYDGAPIGECCPKCCTPKPQVLEFDLNEAIAAYERLISQKCWSAQEVATGLMRIQFNQDRQTIEELLREIDELKDLNDAFLEGSEEWQNELYEERKETVSLEAKLKAEKERADVLLEKLKECAVIAGMSDHYELEKHKVGEGSEK